MNLNKVFIIGRLTADPQVRQTPSGQSVSSLGVATNRTWTDKAGVKQEQTEFHNVVVWGRQAEIVGQFLTKGSMIFIEGRLQTRSWQDKQGQQRKSTEIISERIQLGPRPAGGARPSQGFGGGHGQASGSQAVPQQKESQTEELPTINMDEPGSEEIKPEDLPF
ncbi:MAG: single-stranded DNA-binding protein [Patescibacteria group bacterium]